MNALLAIIAGTALGAAIGRCLRLGAIECEHRAAIREYAEQIARLNAVTTETEEIYTAKARLN